MTQRARYVIVGGDAAGMSAAMQIRRRRPEAEIVVLERGRYTSYAACGIPYHLAGDIPEFDQLIAVTPETFRTKRGIDVRLGCEATRIDTEAKVVHYRDLERDREETVAYDRVLIATGARGIRPEWPGVDLDGVTLVRNLADARYLAERLQRAERAVVVGAGYVGLEMAEALARRGIATTVVERLPDVMGGLDPTLTRLVAEVAEERGVRLLLERTVEGFDGSNGRLEAVVVDGESLPADLAIVALGVRPETSLAEASGIPLGATGAIAVDSRMRTAVPDVYAAGDCVETHHRISGRRVYVPLALTANRQGRVAGQNMVDVVVHFPGIVGTAVTKFFDLAIARTGLTARELDELGWPHAVATAKAPSKAHYYPGHTPLWLQLRWHPDDGRILGALIAGRDESVAKRIDVIATAATAGMTVEELSDLDLAYAPPFAPVWDPVLQIANKARLARNG